MALDVNGYNSRFRSFVEFAQQRVDANDAKAVIDAKIQQPLGGRKILAVTQSRTDEVHKFVRTFEEYAVNDRTRDLFKKAVSDMFGGESKIPASVKKAMLMSDYNAGKPLTARRILAAFAIFPLATLSPVEFPDAFDKFVSFATALADRLDAERAGMSVPPEGEPPADGETPAFDPGLISV